VIKNETERSRDRGQVSRGEVLSRWFVVALLVILAIIFSEISQNLLIARGNASQISVIT
jgi:hypothetical protein